MSPTAAASLPIIMPVPFPVQFPIGGSAYNGGVGGFNYFRVLDDSGYVWMSKIDYTTNTSSHHDG
jgi:hypothetical protein